ncbi:MAG: START domain-containing protein [Bacteroidetes bacterium]|nr:START domain-containing protein [Bacteroidota bacterium]
MKKSAFLLVFSFLVLSFSPAQAETEPWQLQKLDKGISVYTQFAKGSDYKELKAVCQIKTSLSSIIALSNDVESYPKWSYKCENSRIIKEISDQELIRYQSVTVPWPVDKRDMVVKAHSYQDPKTGVVHQKVTCMAEAAPAVNGYVRVKELRAMWTITPLKNGMVEVEYLLLVDPGGSVPAWVVNLAVVDGPYETALKMKEFVMKEKYQSAVYSFISEPK